MLLEASAAVVVLLLLIVCSVLAMDIDTETYYIGKKCMLCGHEGHSKNSCPFAPDSDADKEARKKVKKKEKKTEACKGKASGSRQGA